MHWYVISSYYAIKYVPKIFRGFKRCFKCRKSRIANDLFLLLKEKQEEVLRAKRMTKEKEEQQCRECRKIVDDIIEQIPQSGQQQIWGLFYIHSN